MFYKVAEWDWEKIANLLIYLGVKLVWGCWEAIFGITRTTMIWLKCKIVPGWMDNEQGAVDGL